MVAGKCLGGLIDPDLHRHFLRLWHFFTEATNPDGLTETDIERMQKEGDAIVEEGRRLLPSVWKLPNGHGFIEVCLYSYVCMYGCMHVSM
jgi:hypothetical protein